MDLFIDGMVYQWTVYQETAPSFPTKTTYSNLTRIEIANMDEFDVTKQKWVENGIVLGIFGRSGHFTLELNRSKTFDWMILCRYFLFGRSFQIESS